MAGDDWFVATAKVAVGVVTAFVGRIIMEVGLIVGPITLCAVPTPGVAVIAPVMAVPLCIASAVPVAKFCTSVMFVGCPKGVANKLLGFMGVLVILGCCE